MAVALLSRERLSAMPPSCLVLCIGALLAQQTIAHEHHDDKIPEGEGVSPDPIVRLLSIASPRPF